MGGGLGGGSSNAAGALIGMNFLFELGLSSKDLKKIGVKLGADVPFFIFGKNARASGIGEILIEEKNIEECLLQNINVIEQNIDDGLINFSNDSFDVVILSQTIQVLKNPNNALEEITRIGETCIVTIPNFGHWRSRLSLLLNGRMPVTSPLPESWHATPNIHLCTLKDFEMLCSELLITIEERVTVNSNNESKWYLDIWFCSVLLLLKT